MADLEQLVLSVSANTTQVARALDRLIKQLTDAGVIAGNAGDKLDNAFNKASPNIDKVSKSLGKTRADTANLAAQFQDIAVQLQGGQSPFTIALQQGTQISQVLGQQGAGGIVKLLGASFTSLLNPVSLATIAIIGVGGALVQYVTKGASGVDNLTDLVKTNADGVKLLKDAWGEAGKEIQTQITESTRVLNVFLGLSNDQAAKGFKSAAMAISNSLTDVIAVTDSIGGSTVIDQTSDKYKAFQSVIDAFRKSVADGNPDVVAFRQGIASIAQTTTDQKVKEIANQLDGMTKSLAATQLNIESTSKSLQAFGPAAVEAVNGAKDFQKAIDALSKTVTPNLTTPEQIEKNYQTALAKAQTDQDRFDAAANRANQLAIYGENQRRDAAEKAASAAESADKSFQRALNSVGKRNAQIEAATPCIGRGAVGLMEMCR